MLEICFPEFAVAVHPLRGLGKRLAYEPRRAALGIAAVCALKNPEVSVRWCDAKVPKPGRLERQSRRSKAKSF